MMNNKHRRVIAFYMIKELKDKINKDDLIDWFINLSNTKYKAWNNSVTVNELVAMAENLGIKVRI